MKCINPLTLQARFSSPLHDHTGTCNLDTISLASDYAAKKFSWYISPGRFMNSVKSKSSFTPQTWTPPRPTDTSTDEQSSKYSVTWHLRGIRITRPTLNPRLQSYFRSMQHVMIRTCHHSSIHNEACSIINAGFGGQPGLLAEGLFIARTARLRYIRTVALLIHDVLIELNMSNWGAIHAVRVHLKEFATSTLRKIFYDFLGDFRFKFNATGLEKADDTLEALRNQQFNAVALYGDLVAFGIIPPSLLVFVMDDFLNCISSISQYRIIYLLVLRATSQNVSPIHPNRLLGWRQRLLYPMRITLRLDDKMVQRWIIEISNLIDKATIQNQTTVQ
ncbi:uncharacterized protein EDB93DRAFT_198409 [Suillus bovinus]|uniref:uncharacterized protein n=1 Tax=Suillus bovinus TaxID=48563 RepID=UPI001B883E42|nr:uncharacterized protein EDB93DRAFT_198409 [Suillus bovinus]KAG2127732.1 hypothetical protein EDB93DRAFT_198409 [Suillus bovinus]